ncbi:MAG TPA: HEAT repeat domain-containing protein [Polyangiaceae bacterium]|jgi:HEAT repeat protein|nr:HEAT repeat domain-containing protein [Polyangiaceae bacterium]
MNSKFGRFLSASIVLSVAALSAVASADDTQDYVHPGRSSVYGDLSTNSLEAVSTPAAILSLVRAPGSAAPTAIWTMLEHGERVECLDCIPYVGKMLYDGNPKTREISAWWLRRRIFGVFGPGEVYQQTIATVTDQTQSELAREYAANALGEFLEGAGIAPVAQALTTDGSAAVRLAAANALIRLNDQGPNAELATALGDADESVRLAALNGATHINVFTNVDKIAALISDPSASVRRRTAQVLGTMKLGDSVVGLIALTSPTNESDAGVRQAAVWALGQIGDQQARAAVLAAMNDADSGVRDAANIASFRL